MDFEGAAQRLARDQQGRRRKQPVALSQKAKREAEFRKRQQEKRAQERQAQRQRVENMETYMRQCERSLGVKQLRSPGASTASATANSTSSHSSGGSSLQLNATSIYGEGDKIALPPSVLEFLSQNMSNGEQQQQQQPWTFRIGILNPDYTFPASPVLQTLRLNKDDDDDEDDESNHNNTEAYLDELKHKYLAYTHGTVVEFTQDEGNVGLPEPIARALLNNNNTAIPVTRTKDVATAAAANNNSDDDETDNTAAAMDVDDVEKTPGHLAWGAFDVPAVPVEICLVHLPKGRTATLKPTPAAVSNGFYNLKDIKLVLEQSLIRTRATLSAPNDTIHTWHRGIKYDLNVVAVTPAQFGAVSCINTDIEIDFAPAEQQQQQPQNAPDSTDISQQQAPTLGRRLNDNATTTVQPAHSSPTTAAVELPPEPPANTPGVVTIQIRSDTGARGQRRFDVATATVADLFAYCRAPPLSVTGDFQLVTRFPRRVLHYDTTATKMTLQEAGIGAGQELFLVEKL